MLWKHNLAAETEAEARKRLVLPPALGENGILQAVPAGNLKHCGILPTTDVSALTLMPTTYLKQMPAATTEHLRQTPDVGAKSVLLLSYGTLTVIQKQ